MEMYLPSRNKFNTSPEWMQKIPCNGIFIIQVPSCWEQQGFGNYNYGRDYKTNGKNARFYDEQGMYKYQFKVPAGWKGKNVNIVFDGSMTDTEVKINGKSAGAIHQGAFYRFKYDITSLLKYPGHIEFQLS